MAAKKFAEANIYLHRPEQKRRFCIDTIVIIKKLSLQRLKLRILTPTYFSKARDLLTGLPGSLLLWLILSAESHGLCPSGY